MLATVDTTLPDIGNEFVFRYLLLTVWHVQSKISYTTTVHTKINWEVKMNLTTAAAGASAAFVIIATHEKREREDGGRDSF